MTDAERTRRYFNTIGWSPKKKNEISLDDYIAGFGVDLPEIFGVSEKQIAYASDLRRKFISSQLLDLHVDVPRFIKAAEKLQLENFSAPVRERFDDAAAKAGKSTEEFFSEFRPEKLKRDFHFYTAKDVAQFEFLLAESSAAKIIDALR